MPQRHLAAAKDSFVVMMVSALMRVSDVIVNITAAMARTNFIVVSECSKPRRRLGFRLFVLPLKLYLDEGIKPVV